MRLSRAVLKLLVLIGLLTGVTAQIKYENHISVLNRLAAQGATQDGVARTLYKSLRNLRKEDLFAALDGSLKPQENAAREEDDDDLKFKSEFAPKFSIGVNIEPQCAADMVAYIEHIKRNVSEAAEWALRMADATGKPGAGLLSGSLTFLGDFDECRAITANYKPMAIALKDREFRGQYCVGRYSIHLPEIPQHGFNYMWAVCIPDSCSESDAVQIANFALNRYNITQLSFDEMTCNMRTVPWTSHAIGVFTMVGVILFLVAVGTALDIMLIQIPKWRKSKLEGEASDNSINGDPSSARYVEIPSVDASVRRSNKTARPSEDQDAITAIADSQPKRPCRVARIFMAFSAFTNAEKLLSFKQAPGTLTCLNGIRVISINWVILGHTCLIMVFAANNVAEYVPKALDRFSFQIIVNGTLSVDTFFVMSGLLVAYATLGHMRKTRGKVNWVKFYVHRYMRLTPVYMITLGFYLSCLPYLFDGPLFPQRDGFEQDHHCQHNWWGNLLYIQNLVKFKPHYCAGWAWYLAVDMQFYVLSPILLIPLYHRPKLGYLVCAIFFAMTTITPFVLTETRNYPAGRTHLVGRPKELGDQNYDLYIAPYCRMGSYLVGLLTGFALYRINGEPVRMHRLLVAAGWLVSVTSGLLVVYGLKDYYLGPGMSIHLSAFYNALARIAWALAVAWVIFACHTGYGGPVNALLSLKVWVPLARLTYVVYMIHMIVMFVMGSTARSAWYVSDWSIVLFYLAALMLSYTLALVVSVLFEAPGLALEKVLLEKKKK